MKKILSVCFLLGFLAFITPVTVEAQDEIAAMVTEEMTSYYKDLVKLDQQIVTAEDAERLENRYKNQLKLVESCYNEYTEIFRYDRKLFGVYENYTDLYQQLGKRIEDLKAEKAKQERLDKLTVKLNRYTETLAELEEAGNRCVANKKNDSLRLIKKQAQECIDEANIEYGANRDFIDEDENLSKQWKQLKDTNTRISAMQEAKNLFSLENILKVVGIFAAVVLSVSMISSKIKAAKLAKPKMPNMPNMPNVPNAPKVKKKLFGRKKKEEDLPSI